MCNRVEGGMFIFLAIILIGIYVLQWGMLAEVKELFLLPLS